MIYRRLLLALSMLFICLPGCSNNESNKKVSSSMAELQAIVDVPPPIQSIRWEIFGTPEYHGGVPGPTDFVTLVAEVDRIDEHWFNGLPNEAGSEFIVPGAARLWLSSPFQSILRNKENTALPLPYSSTCRLYRSRLKKTAAPVKGFVCHHSGDALVYLTLYAAS